MRPFGLIMNPVTGDYLLDLLLSSSIRPEFIVTSVPHAKVSGAKKWVRQTLRKSFYKEKFSVYFKAKEQRIPVISAEEISKSASRLPWEGYTIDFLYVFTFKVIPANVLDKLEIPIVNFHSAFLPFHKGINPFYYVAKNQDKYSGYSIHELTSKVDRGNIYIQDKFPLNGNQDSDLIRHNTLHLGAKRSLEFIYSFDPKSTKAEIDNPDGYYEKKPKMEDFLVDQSMTFDAMQRIYLASGSRKASIMVGSQERKIVHLFEVSEYSQETSNDIIHFESTDRKKVVIVLNSIANPK